MSFGWTIHIVKLFASHQIIEVCAEWVYFFVFDIICRQTVFGLDEVSALKSVAHHSCVVCLYWIQEYTSSSISHKSKHC